jgi:hypothetical protein
MDTTAAFDVPSKTRNPTPETNLGNGFILVARTSSR